MYIYICRFIGVAAFSFMLFAGRPSLSVFLFLTCDADMCVDRELWQGKQAASCSPSPVGKRWLGDRHGHSLLYLCVFLCACEKKLSAVFFSRCYNNNLPSHAPHHFKSLRSHSWLTHTYTHTRASFPSSRTLSLTQRFPMPTDLAIFSTGLRALTSHPWA